MATMNRNENLEEINSDALLGIPYLNYQTAGQKLFFFGSLLVSIVIMLIGSFIWKIGSGILALIILIPLGIGVLFGCNYNQDLSLIKYIILRLTNKKTTLTSQPMEDFLSNKNEIVATAQEDEVDLDLLKEQQKVLLRKVVIGVAIAIISVIIAIVIIFATKESDSMHHEVYIDSTSGYNTGNY